ncbi:hypothetical protein OpiT1DRAFT_02826 [Opitutaceae bacterium TAV1]|nr:hypothetical protein OpiT1DRAFT_02826 [Opitutaceae bacterium TAV1]
MTITVQTRLAAIAFLASALPAAPLAAAEDPAAAAAPVASAPSWTLKITGQVRFSWDSNLYLQNRGTPANPAVAAPAKADAFAGSVLAGIGTTHSFSGLGKFEAGYSAEYTGYSDYHDENHTDHRLHASLAGKDGFWKWDVRASALLTDGADRGPVYDRPGGSPAIGAATVRDRRDQLVLKADGKLTRELDGGFVRGVFAAMYQDFYTRNIRPAALPGYCNYVDRAEAWAGIERGWTLPGTRDFALVASLRGGGQWQDELSWVDVNSSNLFLRPLVGVEGKLSPTLTLGLFAGPDFRRYTSDMPRTGDDDRHPVLPYTEGNLRWEATEADTLTVKLKSHRWVSASGSTAYDYTSLDLQWTHRFDERWSARAGYWFQSGDWRDSVDAPAARNDWIHTMTAGVTRTFAEGTTLDFSVLCDIGDSRVAGNPGREYEDWQAAVTLRHAW